MLTLTLALTVLVIVVAVAFDFVNGFHDAANSIATIVATRVLTPRQAVIWASVFNFIALFFFGTGVAKTVGSGMISLDAVTPTVILCGLIGAVVWGILTWWLKMPTSSSHALLGGYAGAAMTHTGMLHGFASASDALIVDGWTKTLAFIVIAPVIGMVLAHGLVNMTNAARRGNWLGRRPAKLFAKLQLLSSAFLSLMHGSNDAQKTAGIITGVLVASGYLPHFDIPLWVLWLSYSTMGLGTFFGGWRIVETLGHRLTKLKPQGGFCAETSAALAILLSTELHLPVSTTHVTTGGIIGVGAAKSIRSVHWKTVKHIVTAWILTMPAAALMGGLCVFAASLVSVY